MLLCGQCLHLLSVYVSGHNVVLNPPLAEILFHGLLLLDRSMQDSRKRGRDPEDSTRNVRAKVQAEHAGLVLGKNKQFNLYCSKHVLSFLTAEDLGILAACSKSQSQ